MPIYKKFSDPEVFTLKRTFLASSYYPSKKKIKDLAKSMRTSCLKVENWFKYNRRKLYFDGEFDGYKIRKTFNQEELSFLYSLFKSNKNPDIKKCQEISKKIKDVSGYQIKNWFANQRRKIKNGLFKKMHRYKVDDDEEDLTQDVKKRRNERRMFYNKKIMFKRTLYNRKPKTIIKPENENINSEQELLKQNTLHTVKMEDSDPPKANLSHNFEKGLEIKLEKSPVNFGYNPIDQSNIKNAIAKIEWNDLATQPNPIICQNRPSFPFFPCQQQKNFQYFNANDLRNAQNYQFMKLHQNFTANGLSSCYLQNPVPGNYWINPQFQQTLNYNLGGQQGILPNIQRCFLQNQKLPLIYNKTNVLDSSFCYHFN